MVAIMSPMVRMTSAYQARPGLGQSPADTAGAVTPPGASIHPPILGFTPGGFNRGGNATPPERNCARPDAERACQRGVRGLNP